MKPVAIFRHFPTEGPGFLADFLDEQSIPWRLVRVDAGDSVPDEACDYSGLVFMGGPMSVNDDLSWIPLELELIGEAVGQDIPVLGHCLGGQLMARALGASVVRNHYKEIGWGRVTVEDNDTARSWFGSVGTFDAFHWHGETFNLPVGAAHLLSSPHCANQAFAVGKHLALQCHIEITTPMINTWCEHGAGEIRDSASSPAVQSADAIMAQVAEKLPPLHEVARRLYGRWVSGLVR
ncbi:MAG TPA: type 1 glutamine amidotransferase [Gallionellaceae bacterium]